MLKIFSNHNKLQSGFTMFELIVVLVGLIIVVALMPWAYSSFTASPELTLPDSVREKLINISLLKSDLNSAQEKLEAFKTKNGSYPKTDNCLAKESIENICLEPSQGSIYKYQYQENGYRLEASKDGVARPFFIMNSNTNPVAVEQTE